MKISVLIWYRDLEDGPIIKEYWIDLNNSDYNSQVSVLVGKDFSDKIDVSFEF